MEQLISTATIPFCIMFALLVFGFGLIGASICSFLFLKVENKNIHTIFILGVIMLIPGFYFKNIFDKYNEQMMAIVKPVISESYPDATDFSYSLDTGSFTDNGIKYKFKYKKTIGNEEKLIITVNDFIAPSNDEQSKNKNVKTLDVPKETKNNEFTND